MAYTIKTLEQENAVQIADRWNYPGIYSFYNMTEDPEDYEELITPALRGDRYYEVLDEAGALAGFFAANPKGRGSWELGLGMKPELTGGGRGAAFLTAILDYLKARHHPSRIELAVAAFNQRAIKVYEKAGFRRDGVFPMRTNGSVYDFVAMSLQLQAPPAGQESEDNP